jgi:hypothetical protein
MADKRIRKYKNRVGFYKGDALTGRFWTITPLAFPLDNFAAPKIAYSVRQLLSTYTGPCMKVKRSSDNAQQDIGFVNGLLDITELETFCSGTNGFVEIWYDQSGNNHDISGAADLPRIVINGVTEGFTQVSFVPSIKCGFHGNGLGVFRLSDTVVIGNPNSLATYFMIGKKYGTTRSEEVVFDGNGGPRHLLYEPTPGLYVDNGTLTLQSTNPIPTTEAYYINAHFQSANYQLQMGTTLGKTTETSSNAAYTDNNGLTIASLRTTDVGGYQLDSFISEFIVYEADIFSQIDTIQDTLNQYYNF